jgi:MFS family permease
MEPPRLRPFARLPRNIAPLGYSNFLLYWVGFLGSNTGRAMEKMGTLWLIYELSNSPALVGLVGLSNAVPALLVSPIAGVIADRVDQRKLLMTTQGVAGALSLALGVLTVTGTVELWHIYLQVLLAGTTNTFDQAARQALFPRLAPRQLLPEAVTLGVTAGRSSALLGPAIGGIAIAGLGVAAPFFLNAFTDILLFGAVMLMRGVVPRARVAGSSMWGEFVEGLRHIADAPVLRGLLAMEVVFQIFHLNAVMIVIIGREVLDVGPEGMGGLLSAPALGGVIAIIALLILGQPRRQGRFMIACTLMYSGALVALAFGSEYIVSFAILIVAGCLESLIGVTRQSTMQLATRGRLRGRTMANTRMLHATSGELSATQSGFLTGAAGVSGALAAGAGALVVGAIIIGRLSPELWRFAREGSARDTIAPEAEA